MFDELDKYKQADHFFFRATDDLAAVCNAPNDCSGVYLIYALKGGRVELVYIGRSGEIKKDGTLSIRKVGVGGLRDRLINGKQFGDARRHSWSRQLKNEGIDAIDVYWYATHCEDFTDCPKELENKLLQNFYDIHDRLPRWNRG